MATRMYHPSLLPTVVTVGDDEVARMEEWGWVALGASEQPPPAPSSGGGLSDAGVAALVGNPASATSGALKAAYVTVVGSTTTPITDAATARPAGAAAVYWVCANGVTPSNAAAGDLIWNAA